MIKDGFVKSYKLTWKLFSEKFKSLLALSLLELLGYSLLLLLVGGLAILTIGWSSIVALAHNPIPPSLYLIESTLSQSLPWLITIIVLFSLIAGLLGSFFFATKVGVLHAKKPLSAHLRDGRNAFLKVFILELILFLIFLGASIPLAIPGLLFLFFASFSSFELVIHKQSLLTSFSNSYLKIKSNFWPILLRVIVILVLTGIIRSLLQGLGIISWIAGILLDWFAFIYFYLLYKDSTKTKLPQKVVRPTWIPVFAIIGYLLIVLLSFQLVKLAQNPYIYQSFQTILEENQQ